MFYTADRVSVNITAGRHCIENIAFQKVCISLVNASLTASKQSATKAFTERESSMLVL